jgi:DNA-binding NarL/FixJ family response regulator
MMSARILLVDDHQILREGLRSLLEKQVGLEVVGETGDGRTALQLVQDLRPDLVIMDVTMPDLDGIDATRLITHDHPGTKVLALSMYLRKVFVVEMLKSGASGYLLKENAFAEIVEAIKTILAGEKYVCRKAAGLLAEEYTKGQDASAASTQLTEHETAIIRLLANGKTSKEIARTGNVSVKTVDACRRRVMQKLGVASTADLVKYAIREGLTLVDG